MSAFLGRDNGIAFPLWRTQKVNASSALLSLVAGGAGGGRPFHLRQCCCRGVGCFRIGPKQFPPFYHRSEKNAVFNTTGIHTFVNFTGYSW